jgi:DNA-binding NtrC family response regulator
MDARPSGSFEDILPVAKASNRRDALESLLQVALEMYGMERAFLLGGASAGDSRATRVLACVSKRHDGARRPSRSLARRVLVAPDAPALIDPRDGEAGASVRDLGLRSVLAAAAPLPRRSGESLVLLLDSRLSETARPPHEERAPVSTLERLAALAALLVSNEPRPEVVPEAAPDTIPGLVGRSESWLALLERARRLAPSPFPLLIRGESGTGKDRLARTIHRLGPRADGPYIPVNCAALSETLIESELFGAVRGAYTGAERDRPGLFRSADGGTLFLDEIGDMPLTMQAKLLRVLEDQRVRPVGGHVEIDVSVRIVAATHRDLAEEAGRGTFRSDLLYRLAVLELRVPPLRERLDDLPRIGAYLVERLAAECGLAPRPLDARAIERMRRHAWPGNVRELRAVLARALLRGSGPITASDLELAGAADPAPDPERPLEHTMIADALRESGGNLARAAARIGWTRQKLYRRMAAVGVERSGRGRR